MFPSLGKIQLCSVREAYSSPETKAENYQIDSVKLRIGICIKLACYSEYLEKVKQSMN